MPSPARLLRFIRPFFSGQAPQAGEGRSDICAFGTLSANCSVQFSEIFTHPLKCEIIILTHQGKTFAAGVHRIGAKGASPSQTA